MRMVALWASVLLTTPAAAQEIPDPASVAPPDLSSAADPAVAKDGWKHFFFWKPGMTYRQAYLDFADCYRFLPVGGALGILPIFAPWREAPKTAPFVPTPQFGLVGALIGSMVAGPIERRSRQSRLRRCLEPRGYVRFALSQDAWEALVGDFSPASIAIQAKAATAPRPNGQEVTR